MANHVGILNGVEYSGRAERLLDGTLLAPGGTLRGRAGQRPGAGLEVSVGGTPEAVTVQPGVGIVNTGSNGDGSYRFAVDSAVSVNLAARPSSGTSRIDLVVARLYDADVPALSTTDRLVAIEVVTGSAASSPTVPSAPAGSLVLAQLTVPASGSVAVGGTIARTVAAGGVLPVGNAAERDALVAYDGMVVYREDLGRLQERAGGEWHTLARASEVEDRLQAGVVFVNYTSGRYAHPVVFPTPFAAPPAVVASPVTNGPDTADVSVNNVTATGFDLMMWRSINNVGINAMWIATPAT